MPRKVSSSSKRCSQTSTTLHLELVKATASSVKKEVRDYSKAISLAKYDGDPSDPLCLKHIKSEDFLEEASKRIPIPRTIVTTLHKVGTQ